MFPCKVYFSLISCPYLSANQLCNRPYCQFNHAENSGNDSNSQISSYKKFLDTSIPQQEKKLPPPTVLEEPERKPTVEELKKALEIKPLKKPPPSLDNLSNVAKEKPPPTPPPPVKVAASSSTAATTIQSISEAEKAPPKVKCEKNNSTVPCSKSASAVGEDSNERMRKVNKFLFKRYHEIFINTDVSASKRPKVTTVQHPILPKPPTTTTTSMKQFPPVASVQPKASTPSSIAPTPATKVDHHTAAAALISRFRSSDPIARAKERLHNKLLSEAANESSCEVPTMPLKVGTNVPLLLRQKYLKQLWLECGKIYGSNSPLARQRTLQEEQTCCDKSTSKAVYINSLVACIRRLRQELPSSTNAAAASHNIGIYTPHKLSDEELQKVVRGPKLYELLCKYLLTEEQLRTNGYPRPHVHNKNLVEITLPGDVDKSKFAAGNCHACCRCGVPFTMDIDYPVMKECVYHWGKAFGRRIPGVGFEQRYTCCSAPVFQTGCQISRSHVFDTNKWTDTKGYQRALPPMQLADTDFGVYALDCEMVYTSAGMELARITVVDREWQTVYDTLVRPINPILDYNTRFSGLSEATLQPVTTNIVDVQSHLMHLFNEKTILIGHSLESDLVALKFLHDYVVDTSLVFPHRLGPPKKRALKNIASDELGMVIQNNSDGHDSCEDALACMKLMQLRAKMDYKRMNRLSGD